MLDRMRGSAADAAQTLLICARNLRRDGTFGSEPGKSRYLEVPADQVPDRRHAVARSQWRARAIEQATEHVDAQGYRYGHALVLIHGYNNDQRLVMARHALLRRRLRGAGYRGTLISFDWPSADRALNYLEDRADARRTALQLVSDGILVLANLQEQQQRLKCDINVHLLGHSTGAYVIREAFDDADDHRRLSLINWSVSQIALIGGDISARSISASNPKSASLVRHATRITNYSNPFDSVLKLSNVKRLGAAPRLGRVGLPADAPSKCVDIDCGDHWQKLRAGDSTAPGSFAHSWHFDDELFARDLVYTLRGDIDRHRVPTRRPDDHGRLHLSAPPQR